MLYHVLVAGGAGGAGRARRRALRTKTRRPHAAKQASGDAWARPKRATTFEGVSFPHTNESPRISRPRTFDCVDSYHVNCA